MKLGKHKADSLIAIHQLHYLPWLRYFHKIQSADLFVALDDVQFTKNDWQNRNKIKTARGSLILTVPVQVKLGMKIKDVRMPSLSFLRKHLRSLKENYSKAPYYEEVIDWLMPIYEKGWQYLWELNYSLLQEALNYLGFSQKVLLSSSLEIAGRGTKRLVEIVKQLGGKGYLTGAFALQEYLDPKEFEEEGIDLYIQEWACPEYPQQFLKVPFLKDLSMLDLLFNCGQESSNILGSGGSIAPYRL